MAGAQGEAYDAEDLVTDRALEEARDDRLGHTDFARQLARLAVTTPTPANIALFGRWGSGKSGLANLLQEAFQDECPENQQPFFLKFDAFKWLERPLLRQFLLQVAEAAVKDSKDRDDYRRRLYETEERTRITPPKNDRWGVVRVFALWLLIATAALLVVVVIWAALLAALGDQTFPEEFGNWLGDTGSVLPVFGAVFAAAATFFSRTFTTRHTKREVSSGEQFEELFRELVGAIHETQEAEGRQPRLVVFVDELDRCRPREVAETLEALKTFLEVEGCVFIVGADQKVLERALNEEARQTTPPDPANPYYSAGSSYLDKIFQHQLTLPPLPARRLTGFARELVKDRGGVWGEVENLDQVLSTLIPSHVRSPRRVKVLLNNFALTYRLASEKVRRGALPEGLQDRASEVAKLVCLRTEFPLFAADLSLDARLTSLVLDALSNNEPEEHIPDWLVKRAKSYANRSLPVDEYLSSPPGSLGDDMVEAGNEAGSSEGEDGTSTSPAPSATERAHSEHLLSYLQKTQHVPGPRRDLIYLEGSSYGLDLDFEIGSSLEEAAVDRRIRDATRTVQALEEVQQAEALKLLARLTREAAVGEEARNVVSTLLELLGTVQDEAVEAAAGEVADAVAAHQSDYRLRSEDLPGALRLGIESGRDHGKRLVDAVLAREEVFEIELAEHVLRRAAALLDQHKKRLSEVTASILTGEPTTAARAAVALGEIDGGVAGTLIDEAGPGILERLRSNQYGEEEGEEGDAASRSLTVAKVLDAFFECQARSLAHGVAALALWVAHEELDEVVRGRLSSLSPVTHWPLAQQLLEAARRRRYTEWPEWVLSLDPTASYPEDLDDPAGKLVAQLWEGYSREDENESVLDECATALVKLRSYGVSWDEDVITEQIVGAFPSVRRASHARQLGVYLRAAARFLEHDLAPIQSVADAGLDGVAETLALGNVKNEELEELEEFVRDWRGWLTEHASPEGLMRFVEGGDEWSWPSPPLSARLRLEVAEAARAQGQDVDPPIDKDQLEALLRQEEEDALNAVAVWVRTFSQSDDDLWTVLHFFKDRAIPSVVREGCVAGRNRFGGEERARLRERAASAFVKGDLQEEALEVVGWREADEEERVAVLTTLMQEGQGPTNSAQRNNLLRLWEVGGITSAEAQRQAIENVFLPIAETHRTALGEAIDFSHLVANPPQDIGKRALRERLLGLADEFAEGREARRLKKRVQEGPLGEEGWLDRFRKRGD